MGPRYSSYNEKSRDPKIEPCGTPYDSGAERDSEPPRLTHMVLSARWDLNHTRAVPEMPTRCYNRGTKMLWSTVSYDALDAFQIQSQSYKKLLNVLQWLISKSWMSDLHFLCTAIWKSGSNLLLKTNLKKPLSLLKIKLRERGKDQYCVKNRPYSHSCGLSELQYVTIQLENIKITC